MIGDLDTTSDPDVLVPGSARTVRLDADDVEARAREMTDAAKRIRARVVDGWSGETAAGWTTRQVELSTTLDAVAAVYLTVAAALRRHGDVLAEARRDAQDAVDLWNGRGGLGEPSLCRAPVAWSPTGGTAWLTGSLATPADRQRAQQLLASARADVRSSGSALAVLLQEFSDGLPDGRWHAGRFLQGLLDWALNVAAVDWRYTMVRAVVDLEGTVADGAQASAGVVATWSSFERDPYNTATALLDAKTLQDDPALWWGRAAPDLVLAASAGAASGFALVARSGVTSAQVTSTAAATDVGASSTTVLSGSAPAAAALEAAARARATLYTGARDLRWRVASEAQMAEPGKVIAGPGSPDVLKDAPRLVSQYGGAVEDWVKMTSHSYTRDDRTFQTHWYENLDTGVRLEAKTKVDEWEKR